MSPANPDSDLENTKIKMEKELDNVVLSLSCIHQEMADFMEEYDANNKKENLIDRAKVREQEDIRATEFVKKFKNVLQMTKHAGEIRKLQNCFDRWNKKMAPELLKQGKQMEGFVAIPLKMAGLFYFYGDYYRALYSLKKVLSLQPFNLEARSLLIKWAVYLGEWEVAETFLANEKKALAKFRMVASQQEYLEKLHGASTAFVNFCRSKDQNAAMEFITEELTRLEQKNENSFLAKDLEAFLWYLSSHFGKIQDASEATFDPLHCILKSYDRCHKLVSNKLVGVFKEDKRLNLVQLFEDPIFCLETLAYVAEYFDRVRDSAMEYFNLGLVRDALAMAENGLKLAYKLGCFPRALEFANLSCLISFDVSPVSATFSFSVIKARLQTLMPGETRPAISSPARQKSPSRQTSIAAQKMLESFEEFHISEGTRPKRLHNVDFKCPCDVCVLYFTSSSTAINYLWAVFLYHNINEQAIAQMQTEFAAIRERVMPLQQKLLGKVQRLRPPLWMCEVFCSSAVRWLRHSEQNGRNYLADEKKAATRSVVLDGAIKITEYSRIRLICYLLSLRQFKRHSFIGGASELPDYSWMNPSTSENESTISRQSQSSRSAEAPVDAQVLKDAMRDFNHFNHLLYRDWRFPICTFIARHSTDPWQAAMMWNESTVLSTRQQARMKTGKMDVVGFSRGSSFQAAMKRAPADYTVVQLTTDENGSIWLAKLFSDRDPIIIPMCGNTKVAQVRKRLLALMKENNESESSTKGKITATKFWAMRRDIDMRLGQVVNSAQTYLFKALAPFLLPSHSLASKGQRLSSSLVKHSSLPKAMAEELVSLAIHIEEPKIWKEMVAVLGEYCKLPEDKISYLQNVYAKLRKEATSAGVVKNHPAMFTLLTLSPILSIIPFESMEIFEKRPHVGRIVSIHAFFKQLSKTTSLPRRVDMTNSYYVLDPDNCLLDTQRRMKDFLGKLQLKHGLIGGAPSSDELQSVLEDKDIFFFLGHGSGSKHLSRRAVKESTCNAVSVLMGCGSVNLDYDGWALDGKCTAYDYTLAHCPALIGCVWMVTDGEIDRYFMELMNSCFSNGANTTLDGEIPRLRNIMDAMRKARAQTKLPYLTGAAVVCYGLPVASCD